MRIKLENIPVPEAHVIAIILSIFIRLFIPGRIFNLNLPGQLLGWLLVVVGLAVSVWAAAEVEEMRIASPEKLITTGPYAYSRNPMYVGWNLIFLGLIFVLNSPWPFGLLVIVLVYTHFYEIRPEEAFLQKKFGSVFEAYKNKVRRYI